MCTISWFHSGSRKHKTITAIGLWVKIPTAGDGNYFGTACLQTDTDGSQGDGYSFEDPGDTFC